MSAVVLPENLQWLAQYRQFIVCQFVADPKRPGKTNKLPIDPATSKLCDAHDRSNWMSADDAIQHANKLNAEGRGEFGIGFVLTPELGVWCLDIDNGCADGQWLPAVQEIFAQLPGVAWEFSHSGTGLHGWGRTRTPVPAHETRTDDAALASFLEFYSRKRFIALGREASGTVVETDGLPALLVRLFPALSAEDAAADHAAWTDEPNDQWHGPTDDDALITIGLKSRSKLATLWPSASTVTFRQLWEADADKLAKRFPAPKGYDQSRADQALACHLAFLTGNHSERMAALMRRSALNRPKFEREDYLRRTINKACSWTRVYYNDGKGIVADAPVPENAAATSGIALDDFYSYLPARGYMFVPTRDLWPAGSVNASVSLGSQISASDWLDRARPLHSMTWAPGAPMVLSGKIVDSGGWIDREGLNTFNLYRPPIARIGGDPAHATPWLDLLNFIYPGNTEHLITWFAHRRQRPGEKINHAIVLGGAPGIGKDSICEPLKHAVGPWNFVEISPNNLTGEFNGYRKSVVLRVSEARDQGDINRYALYEATKTLLATPPDVLRCNEKNLREHDVFNVMGVIFTTNHHDGLYLPRDDRRHFVVFSERVHTELTDGYWRDFYRWYDTGGIAHVIAYLDAFDLSRFDPKAPPPKTAAFWRMVDAGAAPESSDLADALEALGHPAALTIAQLVAWAATHNTALLGWLRDSRNGRQIPHRLDDAGYAPVRNPGAESDGRWKIKGRRTPIYARKELTERDRIAAASALCRDA